MLSASAVFPFRAQTALFAQQIDVQRNTGSGLFDDVRQQLGDAPPEFLRLLFVVLRRVCLFFLRYAAAS